MTSNAKEKQKFRATAQWKKFRNFLKKNRKVDELTNSPLRKGWQLHHLDLDPKNYKTLLEENFSCLNIKSHDLIHFLYRYYEKDKTIINRLENILEKMYKINNKSIDNNNKKI